LSRAQASALFGSGPPGGTINIVHYKPSADLHYGASMQAGSFGTVVNNDYITGPTTLPGLGYRIDGTFLVRMVFAISPATTTRFCPSSNINARPTRPLSLST
jgi:hypothetical protein